MCKCKWLKALEAAGHDTHDGSCTDLFVLVLLQVARRHEALGVDVRVGELGGDELRVRAHVLHLEEGQNVLDLQVVGAVRHGLAF